MAKIKSIRALRFKIWLYTFVFLMAGSLQFAWTSNATAASAMQQVLEKGVLRVGVALFAPWVFKEKDGELTGFEVDVANKLAKDMGVTAQLVPFDWDELIPALTDGKIDIIISGMSIVPDRALKVNFSVPYATSGTSLATNIGLTKNIKRLEELNDPEIKIGVISKTVAENLARRVFDKASIVVFQKTDAAKDAVVTGKIHVYIESNPIPRFIALEHPEKVDVPLSEPLLITKEGFAINKGDADFLSFLNSWIVARKADTWLKSTHEYWFESLQWK